MIASTFTSMPCTPCWLDPECQILPFLPENGLYVRKNFNSMSVYTQRHHCLKGAQMKDFNIPDPLPLCP